MEIPEAWKSARILVFIEDIKQDNAREPKWNEYTVTEMTTREVEQILDASFREINRRTQILKGLKYY